MNKLNRRHVMAGMLATPMLAAGRLAAQSPVFIADMHYHLFFVGKRPASTQPLAANMARGRATLVSWSLVGDMPWLSPAAGGFKPHGRPDKGEAVSWLGEELRRVKAHLADQDLKVVLAAGDVEQAVAGQPRVVLSVEGATFADDGLQGLQKAFDAGIRHVQLVHFLDNRIGDIQTARPSYGGLSDYGRQVIIECERLGLLVDLAHCTGEVVQDALSVATRPLIWSHSSIVGGTRSNWQMPGWKSRQLALSDAKAIAAKGGVVGLWALGADVGTSPQAYAARVEQVVDLMGDDHVGFGSDMNALASPALANFADLRRVVDELQRRGLPETTVRKVAVENYARVLRLAFQARPA